MEEMPRRVRSFVSAPCTFEIPRPCRSGRSGGIPPLFRTFVMFLMLTTFTRFPDLPYQG
jgi:hypothetical protein